MAHQSFLSPRKAMTNVSNLPQISPNYQNKRRERSAEEINRSVAGSSSSSAAAAEAAIISPSKIRHRLFTDEASKLAPGEQLQSCPRCTSPSRVVPFEFRATCTRASCGFEFCTRCMCQAHAKDASVCKNSDETTGSDGKGKKLGGGTVASKRSKNRLKRL